MRLILSKYDKTVTDKTAGREGPAAASEEDKARRKEGTRLLRESHPSARFWKR